MNISRFIIIFVIFSISLSVITVLRGFSPVEMGITSPSLELGDSYTAIYRWPPRIARIELRSSGNVHLKIYHYIKGENHTILSEYAERGIFNINIPRRGLYYVQIQNISNKSVEVNLYITLFGFEKDLMRLSIILDVLSVTITLLCMVSRLKREHR